jgi:uncharacterized membrane protein
MDTKRIEALADGVFAIAMTLLVIEIHVPEVPAGSSLAAALLHLAPNVIAYAVSFVILGTLWVGHHAQFHFIKRVDRPLLWIDIHFLLFIAFLPFSTALLAQQYREPLAATIYGATLLGAGVFLYWHWHHATSGRRLVDPALQESVVRTVKRRILGGHAVYASAVLLSRLNPYVGLALFAAMPLGYMIPGHVDRHMRG